MMCAPIFELTYKISTMIYVLKNSYIATDFKRNLGFGSGDQFSILTVKSDPDPKTLDPGPIKIPGNGWYRGIQH